MDKSELEAIVGQYANELMIESQRRIFAEVKLAAALRRLGELEPAASSNPES